MMGRIIGLTGLIGTGKSTVASILKSLGCAVFDADREIHALYEDEVVKASLHEAFGTSSRVDILIIVQENAAQRTTLESILHPLVKERRMAFLKSHENDLVVLDIPLLFETGANEFCDVVWVTHCAPETQRARVLQRPGFTEAKLATILAWQTDRRAQADRVIDTDVTLEALAHILKTALDDLHA